jgi:CheY-like chemotaxis protein
VDLSRGTSSFTSVACGERAGDPVQKQRSGTSILIIEDNLDLRVTLSLFLEDLGYPTVRAANGLEALSQLRSTPLPGLILLDLIMPVMNGWVFRAEQRQDPQLSAIPIVVISGADGTHRQAVALNAVACLGKPIDLNTLLALVTQYCR